MRKIKKDDSLSYNKNYKLDIIGEICNSLKSKKGKQIYKYTNYIKQNNNCILMIIFDFNYADLFYDTKHFSNLAPIRKEKIPVIFGYIPKLYREDCYNIYNKNESEANKVNIQKYIKKICNKSDFEYYKEKIGQRNR